MTCSCEFCGHEFPEELGRYGCPNCEGEGLDAAPHTNSSQAGLSTFTLNQRAMQVPSLSS